MIAPLARVTPGQQERLQAASRSGIGRKRIALLRPTESARRAKLDVHPPLAGLEGHCPQDLVVANRAAGLCRKHPRQRFVLDAVDHQRAPLDHVPAQGFAGFGVQYGTHDDFGLAVAREVTRCDVDDILRIAHAQGDEGIAQALPKTLAEHHQILAVHEHAFGAAVTSDIGHEIETWFATAHFTVFSVERVYAVEQLVRARRARCGGCGRLIIAGGPRLAAFFGWLRGCLRAAGLGRERRLLCLLEAFPYPLESAAANALPRQERRAHVTWRDLRVGCRIEALGLTLRDLDRVVFE